MDIENITDGINKIDEGIKLLRNGPSSYYLKSLLAAHKLLTEKYLPFPLGSLVKLAKTPKIAPASGWYGCRHFLVKGATAVVKGIRVDPDGLVGYDLMFDKETWKDEKGRERPVDGKHTFAFIGEDLELVDYPDPERRPTDPAPSKPCVIIGWPTIAQLAAGHTVRLSDVDLLPDDLLHNTAAKVARGDLNSCECTEPREVVDTGHRCVTCGCPVPPSEVQKHHHRL